MFAIIKAAGQQFRVEKDKIVVMNRIEGSEGGILHFDNVLMIQEEKNITIGSPFIAGAKVEAELIKNFRGEKILIFKKRRRKNYRRMKGHRQELSMLKVKNITLAEGKND